jgi:2-dehydro-3-deoxyphosphogluconate aldolase/(4S)-4-hydroxy-2-oxoglutarate aldolase
MQEEQIIQRIHRCGVVAVLTIDDARHAVPLARALLAGGVDVMELTLRTPVALDALRAVIAQVPQMLAGLGTVLSPQQVSQVRQAGAAFAVAPGLNPRVVQAARSEGLFFAPGVVTPSDIERALEMDCRMLKFFPAELSGGLPYLKSIAAPYAHLGVRFIPLGGVSPANVKAYLAEPLIAAVGGSWLAPKEKVAAEDWDAITRLAQEATALVRQTRPSA